MADTACYTQSSQQQAGSCRGSAARKCFAVQYNHNALRSKSAFEVTPSVTTTNPSNEYSSQRDGRKLATKF
jgi:hypothetical protein